MSLDLFQLLYCVGFAFLGWWLRSQGLLTPQASNGKPGVTPLPLPLDRDMMIAILKMMLERQTQQPSSVPTVGPATVFHVPVEVSANPKAPTASNGA